MRPESDIAACAAAHDRLLVSLASLRDDEIAAPSLCEGWTIGRVLTHLARNADSHVRMVDGALRGDVVSQYAPGQRDREIDEGATRLAAAIVDDLRTSIDAVHDAFARVTDDVWANGAARTGSGECAIAELPFRRWREVEIHHADLGRDVTYDDMTAEYVAREQREPADRRFGGRTFPTG